jgi:hypothetical protein
VVEGSGLAARSPLWYLSALPADFRARCVAAHGRRRQNEDVSMLRRTVAWFALALVALGAYAWLNDKINTQGERTVYTARCVGGEWQANRCTGKLVASERYRFRALRAHQEVLFWTIGEKAPSGRYSDCEIVDSHNWSCKPNADAARTITHQMTQGRPIPDPNVPTVPFRQVPKWKWLMLQAGFPAGSRATAPG